MPQSIHKVIDGDASANEWELKQGWCVAIPVTIGEGQILTTKLSKDYPSQDYSVRAWLSPNKNGSSLGLYENSVNNGRLELLNEPIYTVAYYTEELENEKDYLFKMKVEPGDYYINLLNLVNSENKVVGEIKVI